MVWDVAKLILHAVSEIQIICAGIELIGARVNIGHHSAKEGLKVIIVASSDFRALKVGEGMVKVVEDVMK